MPMAIGGGGGIIGLIVIVLFNVLNSQLGGTQPATTDTFSTAAPSSNLAQRCNTSGAIDQYNDCYVVKSYNEINEVWDAQLGPSRYRHPQLVFFEQAAQTGCGNASSSVGPFYCPADESIYIDLGFLAELQKRFGANGRYAQTYIVAHEAGHHIQHLSGADRLAANARDSASQQRISIGTELQADCYAGVWSTQANRAGNYSIGEAELNEALTAAAAVGDDRIQAKTQGRVDPESWTHGSAQQRHDAFLTGYRAGQLEACASLLPAR